MKAVRPLVCREAKETSSKKLDEIPKNTLVRLLEEITTEDGTVRAKLGKDGDANNVVDLGWITKSKPGDEELKLDAPPVLKETFDLKAHTAKSLTKALKTKMAGLAKAAQGGPRKKKRGEGDDPGGLPFVPAGHKPAVRDESAPSRHEIITEPAQMRLMFNCFGAAFEVTQWTGPLPFVLPDEQAFDLYPKDKAFRKHKLGRVGLARELRAPFLERIEFPDEWLPRRGVRRRARRLAGRGHARARADVGQGRGDDPTVPWLAYWCSVGARLIIRKASAPQSASARPSQRILGDDRVVARVDGYSKAEGVKGEVILDLQPKTSCRTTVPGYTRDQKLLLLLQTRSWSTPRC